MEIRWDPRKARRNAQKHGVRFPDLEPVFYDPFARVIPDTGPCGEPRFVAIGLDAIGRVVVVVYAWRGKTIRVISARKATRAEKACYEKGIRL